MTNTKDNIEWDDDGDIEVVDLDKTPLYRADGSRFTEADAERLATELETSPPTAGRPPLGGRGTGTSPHVTYRVAADVKERLAREAAREGRKESEIARLALIEYLDRHAAV